MTPRSPTFTNLHQPLKQASRHDLNMALRRTSKTTPNRQHVTAMRVKAGVESFVSDSSTGGVVVLTPGMLFPSDAPIVTEFAWAFEPDEAASAELAVASSSPFTIPAHAAPDPIVKAKLQAVKAEIGTLNKQLPAPAVGVDVNDLADRLAKRTARREALELTLPALEREVMVSELNAAEGIEAIELQSNSRATETLEAAANKLAAARSDFERARLTAAHSESRLTRCQQRTYDVRNALQRHDEHHFGEPEPTEHATELATSSTTKG